MAPQISVIIPIHNAACTLKTCLDSILSQPLKDFEVLCIDDGSHDNSLNILEEYAKKDARVRIFKNPKNLGAGGARNLGLTQAISPFIAFCDADDAFSEQALATLYATAMPTEADICVGNIAYMDPQLRYFIPHPPMMAAMQIGAAGMVSPCAYPPLWIPYFFPRALFRKKFLQTHRIQFPDLLRGEDPFFMAQALCLAKKIMVLPDIVYLYRAPEYIKATSGGKISDYIAHIPIVVDIFLQHGWHKQAALYTYFVAHQFLSLTFFRQFTRTERKNILVFFETLFAQFDMPLDFAPYFDVKDIQRQFSAVRAGFFPFILFKLRERLG